MKKRVEIRIDQLVLHGIAPGQQRAVREAVERELGRLGERGEIAADRPLQIPPVRLPRGGGRL